jgi:hypothetical protein
MGRGVTQRLQQCAQEGAPRLATWVSTGDVFCVVENGQKSSGRIGRLTVCGHPSNRFPGGGCPGCARLRVSSVCVPVGQPTDLTSKLLLRGWSA